MTKKQNLILSVGAIIGGGLLCGFGATSTVGHPSTTICIVLGIGFSVIGFISLVLIVKGSTTKENKK